MYKSTDILHGNNKQTQTNSPGVVRFSAESENSAFSLGRGLAGSNEEFSIEVGAVKGMLDGSETAEYMVNSITVPSEAAETVDCKTYVKAC